MVLESRSLAAVLMETGTKCILAGAAAEHWRLERVTVAT